MQLRTKFANFIYFGNSKFCLLNLVQSEFGLLCLQAHQKSHYKKHKNFSTALKLDLKYQFSSWKNLGTNPDHEFEVASIDCNPIPYFILYMTST